MAVDPAFRNAENIMGLKIWRIEAMEVKAIPEKDYGHFFEGDSYICLHVSIFFLLLLFHWIIYVGSCLKKMIICFSWNITGTSLLWHIKAYSEI